MNPVLLLPLACLASGMAERGDAGRPVSLGSVVSDVYPIRVHWTADGYEDQAAAALEAAELAWQVQVEELGFRAPVLPDDIDGPELDIYMADLDPWEGWAWAPDQFDSTPGDGFMSAPAYVGIDRDLPDEWLASYVAHEFNHVLQYATDMAEESLNVWEATAVAAQWWTLGDEGLWDVDVPDFQAAPWAPVFHGDGYEPGYDLGYYEYGAGLWVLALDDAFGDGEGSFGPALWDALAQEGWEDEPDVVDAVTELAGGDIGDAMHAIALARWAADVRPIVAATVDELPAFVEPDDDPLVLGQAFVRVTADISAADLEVAVVSEHDTRVTVIEDGAALVVVISNLGPPGWDGNDDAWLGGGLGVGLAGPGQEPPTDSGDGCSCSSGGDRRAGALLLFALLVAGRFAQPRARRARTASPSSRSALQTPSG